MTGTDCSLYCSEALLLSLHPEHKMASLRVDGYATAAFRSGICILGFRAMEHKMPAVPTDSPHDLFRGPGLLN